ncbi:DUF2066 domain-containing protein [Rhodospirillaceae bacterium SYSU D60014]|uniref:DUF2066 domain-containing protein n=1 Tax=Virgifigura deserti TaxID=2268457 RepID=UPI000E668D23
MVLPGPRRRVTLVLSALALLATALAASAGRAQTNDLFAVRGIEVDVTAESAAAAREAALALGQRKALDRVLLRLALAEDVARLPPLSDAEITQMVQDFQVESERTSAVRYIGELTFRFRAEPVRRLFERNGVRFAGIVSNPVLVLPVLTANGDSRLWDDPNPWRNAWAERPAVDGLVPLVVPYGDLGDVAAVGAAEALAGDPESFDELAERYDTGDTIVAEAQLRNTMDGRVRLNIAARRYAAGVIQQTYTDSLVADSLTAGEGGATLFERGVKRLDEMVQEEWKRANLVSFGIERTLIATVPVGQISDWVAVRKRLADIAIVRDTEILYLMRNEGRLRVVFVGDMPQLERALAQKDLSLSPASANHSSSLISAEMWVLRLGSAPVDAAPQQPSPTPPTTIVN